MRRYRPVISVAAVLSVVAFPSVVFAFTLAVFDFASQDRGLESMGVKVAALLRADLMSSEHLEIVDREEMKKTLGEMGLGIAGISDESQAPRVGKILGAKALVVGNVFAVDQDTFIVAKLVGVETLRVFAEKTKIGTGDSLDEKVTELAKRLAGLVTKHKKDLVGTADGAKPDLETLRKKLAGKKLPKVAVSVRELHRGSRASDPAAETELGHILNSLGFILVESDPAVINRWFMALTNDPKADLPPELKSVDVVFLGDATSEYAARVENLVSCKARVEIRALDKKTGRILAVDRQEKTEVDLAEGIAAKRAIQKATEETAHRLIPRAVDGWNGR